MELQKVCFVKSVIFILILLVFLPGFQGKRVEIGSYSGVIESIDKDFKFIVVSGTKFLISSDTKITDEKGSILKGSDLKLKAFVAIEGVPNPDGVYAKKIVIQKKP
jgi:hypothetical protein